MCGIVGIAGDISLHMASSVFKDFLDVSQLRGRDSTGVIRVDPACDEYDWMKAVGQPPNLYNDRWYEKRIEQPSAVLIGHTRAKTVGDVSMKNAHPFDYPREGICGVHNGTLRGHHKLDTHEYSKVDSDVLYGHLAANGPENTFDRIEGAYACVWWDDKDKTLNFIRNKERPLWFVWSKDRRQMFWASENWMFCVLRRKGIEFYEGDNGTPFHELPVDTLWSFRINTKAKGDKENVLTFRPTKVIVYKEPEKIPYKAPQYPSQYGGWRWGENGVMTRDIKPSTTPSGGGKVANPFQVRDPEQGTGETGLNDEIPSFLLYPTASISPKDTKSLSTSSLSASKDPKTALTSTSISKRNTLSLPGVTLEVSPPTSNVVSLPVSERPFPSQSQGSSTFRQGVDIRNVGGINYISSRATGNEWEVGMFLRSTKGCCSFCNTTIDTIQQVGFIVKEHSIPSFVCTTCITVPALATN